MENLDGQWRCGLRLFAFPRAHAKVRGVSSQQNHWTLLGKCLCFTCMVLFQAQGELD